MLIRGEWFQCDDEAVRPVLRAEVRDVAGNWIEALFLIDTGADRTVFNSAVFSHLRFAAAAGESRLRSLAGITKGTDLDTTVRLWTDSRVEVLFNSRYAAVMDPETLDMSVLGRDILDLFTLLVERRSGTVLLLREPHRWRVEAG